jgi:hypothetical protein
MPDIASMFCLIQPQCFAYSHYICSCTLFDIQICMNIYDLSLHKVSPLSSQWYISNHHQKDSKILSVNCHCRGHGTLTLAAYSSYRNCVLVWNRVQTELWLPAPFLLLYPQLVFNEGYYYWQLCEQNGWTSAGEFGEVCCKRKRNSSRETWIELIHGTSLYGRSTVMRLVTAKLKC